MVISLPLYMLISGIWYSKAVVAGDLIIGFCGGAVSGVSYRLP
jgi:hypothetical protein